jgi:hypothetical protein
LLRSDSLRRARADRVRETAEDVARSDVAAGDALLAEEDGFVLLHEAPLSSSGSARILTRGLFGLGVRRAGTARTWRLAFPRRDHRVEAVVADASSRKGTLARNRVPLSSEHTSSEPPSWRKRSLIPRKPTPRDPIQS